MQTDLVNSGKSSMLVKKMVKSEWKCSKLSITLLLFVFDYYLTSANIKENIQNARIFNIKKFKKYIN